MINLHEYKRQIVNISTTENFFVLCLAYNYLLILKRIDALVAMFLQSIVFLVDIKLLYAFCISGGFVYFFLDQFRNANVSSLSIS